MLVLGEECRVPGPAAFSLTESVWKSTYGPYSSSDFVILPACLGFGFCCFGGFFVCFGKGGKGQYCILFL